MISVGTALLLLAVADDVLVATEDAQAIVVTGERVRRSVKETDSSVDVFDIKRLDNEPVAHRLDDLFESSPNVTVGNPGLGPTIRGQDTTGPLVDLAAFLGGTRPRMTLNIDGRAASYNEFVFGTAPLWDVEQVEVFRSPQSTVEGRNSIAGATYIRTKSPTTNWEAGGRLMFGERGARQISGMVSGPLGSGQLAFRLSADARRGKPWSKLGDNMNGADPDHDNYALVRGKLLATPQALPNSSFELSLQHLRSKAPQSVTARPPFEDRKDLLAGYGIFENRITSATLRAQIPLTKSLESRSIFSLGESRFQRFAPTGRGEAINWVSDRSFESRLDWKPSEAVGVRGGIHLLESKLDQDIDLTAIIGTGSFDDRQTAFGIFGEIEVGLTKNLSATGSLRRQYDRQRRNGAIVGDRTIPVDFDGTFEFWLPRMAVRWDPSDQVRLGVSLQRASNPGGTSINFVTGAPEYLDAETLWNAELFGRVSLLDGRVTIDANLFYNDHKDAQRAIGRIFTGPGSTLTWYELYNLKRARSRGLEATLQWKPTGKLGMRVGLGLLRTKIVDAGEALAFEGRVFARSPKRSLTFGIDWSPTNRFSLNGRLRHHSGYFSDDLNSEPRKVAAGTEMDLRAAYRRGRFNLFGFARNVADAFQVTYFYSPTLAVPNRPRELGIGLETRF